MQSLHVWSHVLDVLPTPLFKRFPHVSSRHYTQKVRHHVIMTIDAIVKFVNWPGRFDLHFKHYGVTFHTLIDRCLVLAKVFLESDEFLDTRTASQIDTCRIEYVS